MSPYMINSGWVTAQFLRENFVMSHPMTNREWVMLLDFYTSSLINHVSSAMTNSLCQSVTLVYFFARLSHQSCLIPWLWAGSEWLHYFFARVSHQSCLTAIPWPTACEWQCFIALPGSPINPVSSHDQQGVSGAALFLCQSVSSIMSHPTNRMWVTLLYFFARQSHQ